MKQWRTTTIRVVWGKVGEAIANFANKHKLGPGEIIFTKITPPMPGYLDVDAEVAIVYYS